MEPTPLWHVLVMDWSEVENTPPTSRRPLVMQRWHFRVERLARLVERPVTELANELKEEARDEARQRRHLMEVGLAEDLAVCRAQGRPVNPPWRRRLEVLADISGEAYETLEAKVAAAAEAITVLEVT